QGDWSSDVCSSDLTVSGTSRGSSQADARFWFQFGCVARVPGLGREARGRHLRYRYPASPASWSILLRGLNGELDGCRSRSVPIGVEQPVDRQVDRPNHEAARKAERESKSRQVTLIEDFEHAN